MRGSIRRRTTMAEILDFDNNNDTNVTGILLGAGIYVSYVGVTLEQACRERGIDADVLLEAIQAYLRAEERHRA